MRSVKYLGGLDKIQVLQGRGTDPVKIQGLATAVLTCSGKVQNILSKVKSKLSYLEPHTRTMRTQHLEINIPHV